MLVEILYFLAGSVMHHSGVVNNTIGAFLSARVVKRVGLAGNHSIHTGRNTSGGTRHLGFITIKNVSLALTNRRIWRFFLFRIPFLYGSLRRAFFISAPRPAHITSDNTTQKASAGAFDGVLFFTGRWWPFFIYRRKS
ncbi:hypothetical protein, partial [Escherichia coli]|uniref:hypothetical protein n=1 Tax=Escherichia coli TaxID=562 RepID=UPI001F31E260